MSFGASTRVYIIREKPQSQANVSAGDKTGDDEELKGLLGLPEEETELEVCMLNGTTDGLLLVFKSLYFSAIGSIFFNLHVSSVLPWIMKELDGVQHCTQQAHLHSDHRGGQSGYPEAQEEKEKFQSELQ